MAKDTLDKIVLLPLSKVHADHEWNTRFGNPADQGDTGGELPHEFNALVESIRSRGQDQPVMVRAKGQGYSLVYGFRRHAALTKIAEDGKDKNAVIKCIVRELNEIEAISLNLRENLAREPLSPPDMMAGLGQLKDLYEKSKAPVTISALADELGIGRPYASKLLGIREKVMPKFLQAWRESQVEIPVNKMEEMAKLDKGEQQERAWKEVLAKSAGRGAGGGRKDKKAWLESAEREAVRVGTFLGELERLGKISTANLIFKKDLELVVKMKEGEGEKATALQRQKIVEVIEAAYEAALNPPPPEVKETAKAEPKPAAKAS